MSRFRPLDPAALDAEQKQVYDQIAAGPRKLVPAPFHILLRSPGLAAPAQALGAFARYRTVLPPRLSEFVILIVANHWDSAYERHVHEQEARKAGVPEATITALRQGESPAMDADETLLYPFVRQALEGGRIEDTAFDAVGARFGDKGRVEILGIVGWYQMVALMLNAYRVPVPMA
ncbi:MAG: carboxymuconolactone decarboxylase family protein [Alphaproteobacteria bacterium]|nr:carboxymuconolactone decarboxylase family protein [Alphaproteobacteria bacterium]